MDQPAVLAVHHGELAGGNLNIIQFAGFMDNQVIVPGSPVGNHGAADGIRGGARPQHRPGDDYARDPNSAVGGVNRIAALADPRRIKTNVRQEGAVRHGKERRLILGGGMHQEHIRLILGQPVLVVGCQYVPVGGVALVDRQRCALGQVQCIHRDTFHGVHDNNFIQQDIATLCNAMHFLHVLGIAFLRIGDVLARLDLGGLPGEMQFLVGVLDQLAGVLNAVLHLLAAGFAHLAPHFAMAAGDGNDGYLAGEGWSAHNRIPFHYCTRKLIPGY